MSERDYTQEQQWDEYNLITKAYEDDLVVIQRAIDELGNVRKRLTLEYELKVLPLMPVVNAELEEMVEIQHQKYGEELREMIPIEKESEQ
jgi:hypothetical protein